MRGTIPIALLLLASAAAGCLGVGEDTDETPEAELSAQGMEDTSGQGVAQATGQAEDRLTPEDSIPGPSWEVGQWFGYHVFFGVNDTEGIHYDAVVTEDQGNAWLVATDNPEAAKYEAVFDLNVLGTFSKQDLSTTAGGEPWTWYAWPLEQNKTWTATVDTGLLVGGEPNPIELTFKATYNEAIETQDGAFPGFDVVGRTAEGNLTVEYDYVPELGWFGHLFIYDPTTGGSTWTMHIMTMGSGENWTGTYYVDDAVLRFGVESEASLVGPTLEATPHAAATVTEEGDYVLGFAYAYGFGGAHDLRVTRPDGSQVALTAGPFGFAFEFFDEEAMAGDWEVTSLGAGLAAGGGISLWEVIEHSSTM